MTLKPDFILEGSDPFAPNLVRIWACLHNGDLAGAVAAFNELVQSEAAERFEAVPEEDTAAQGVAWADAMEGVG